jgi:hypothetical protein
LSWWLCAAFHLPTNCTPYPYLLALLSLFEWFNYIITSFLGANHCCNFSWILLCVSLAISWSYYALPPWCYCFVWFCFHLFSLFHCFVLYEFFINIFALFVIHLIIT